MSTELIISKQDKNYIQVDSDNFEFLEYVHEKMSIFAENYYYMPKYRAGAWDGRINFFSKSYHHFPHGLIKEFIQIAKNFDEDFIINQQVKNLFHNDKPFKYKSNLEYDPYDYQDEIINICLKRKKCIVISPTASGKTLICAYILKTLLENKFKKLLLVVPNINLLFQTKDKFLNEYNVNYSIGEVYKDCKDFNHPIVISTWQSLANQKDKLKKFSGIIIDEVHKAKAKNLNEILYECSHMDYKIGLTGTMYDEKSFEYQAKSFLGPIVKKVSMKRLVDDGYIAKCNIKSYLLNYNTIFKGNYHEIKDMVFSNYFRLSFIENLINNIENENIVIVVERKEKEGQILYDYLRTKIFNKEIVYLTGDIKPKIRDYWIKEAKKRNDLLLIVTNIFQVGIDIKSLKHLVLASIGKSKIQVMQFIGRLIRMHENKEEIGAFVYDICDNVKYLKEHYNERKEYYKIYEKLEEIEVKE